MGSPQAGDAHVAASIESNAAFGVGGSVGVGSRVVAEESIVVSGGPTPPYD